MAKVKIVTDSNSGITQAEAEKLGISVLPMPFLIDGEQFFEDVNLAQEEFYAHLKKDAAVSTSQPAIGDVTDLWDNLLQEGDCELVHIPMSSGLSESCHTAEALAKEYGGKVLVVNNQRISISQKQSVYDAIELVKRGKSAAEIKEYLESTKYDSSIYIALDTLKYLKKGGRLTPAAALIGTILKIKPVLQIQGEKLDAFKKVNTLKKAKEVMIAALRSDLTTRFAKYVANGEMTIAVAHTDNYGEAEIFVNELKAAFPEIPVTFADPLSLSVSCHIGPGSLACSAIRIVK
ncbi:MAG: DegV family protein [Clostridia bacterium]|jgi:DegV family protein with EDD domain|nr:DegV family protein [Clostridia bacterium]